MSLQQATRSYTLVGQGLHITRTVTRAEWEQIGCSLARGLDNWHWVVGDWLVYGETAFGQTIYADKHQPGVSKYDKPALLTGLSADTLELCAQVARAYAVEDRVAAASWTRHREALSLPEDTRWTTLRQPMTHAAWKKLLTRHRDHASDTRLTHTAEIECPHCGYRWRNHK